MAQIQLNNPRPPHSEESFDTTELDETRPPDPTLSEQPSLSLPPGSQGSEENTPDIEQHSLSLSPPQAGQTISSTASENEQPSLSHPHPPGSPGSEEKTPDTEQHSLSLSPPQAQEEGIPDHEFEIKTTEGKSGRMKGVTREKVSLLIGNHVFRKRRIEKSGFESFTCSWKITAAGQMATGL